MGLRHPLWRYAFIRITWLVQLVHVCGTFLIHLCDVSHLDYCPCKATYICVYMYMYICTRISTYVYMYRYIHTDMYVYMFVNVYMYIWVICMYMCVSRYIYIHLAHMYICISTNIHIAEPCAPIFLHSISHICTCVNQHMYMYTFRTHVHMYINKHTHCRAMRANLSPLASPRMGPGRQEFLKSHLATKSTTENVYRADLREIPVENLKHQLASNTIIGWLRLVGSLKL